jgi:MFS family permease
MVFLTMLFASVALKETHPELRHRKTKYVFWEHRHDESSETPLLYSESSEVEEPSYGATSTGEEEPHTGPAGLNPFRGLGINVWMLVAAICLLSSHTVTYIQLLPIFLRDPPDTSVPPHYIGGVGGLDMSLTQVGLVMGVNGIIGLVVQLLFPFFTERVGIQSTLLLVTTLHPVSYFCVPYLAFIPTSTWRTVGLYTWLTMRNVFSTFTFPILLIYIKRWTPNTLMLGRVNGLVASAGAACRTISPAAAGLLQTIGKNHHFSALAWWGSGMIALVAAVQCWFINTPPEEDDE